VSPRSARRAAIDEEDDEAFARDGMVARLAERAFDNPAMFGGLVVMGLTACAIVSNAVLLQNGRHPEPLFMTRPSPAIEAPAEPAPVPMPRVRAEQTAVAPPMPPLPRVSPAASEAPPEPTAPTLIVDLQRALAEKGLYRGAIDGIPGSRTRAAITAYQTSEGLPVTGEPSTTILDHIRTASIPPAPETTPVPVPEPVVAAESPPDPVAVVEEPLATAAPETAALESYPPPEAEPAPAPVPTPVAATPSPEVVALQRDRYQSVQYALNQIGYGPITVDGKPSHDTENAIRRFELDNGLPITGLPGDKVIERLMAIGALKPT